jgi:hypothetical protein
MARNFTEEDRKAGLTLIVKPVDDPEHPVDAKQFLETASRWLASLTTFASESGLSIRWEIAELRRSSALLEVVPIDTITGIIAQSVARGWGGAMQEMESQGFAPAGISPNTVRAIEHFAASANDLAITISSGDEHFSKPVTPQTQKRLKEAVAALPSEEYSQEGTIRGSLAVLNSWNSEDRWFRLRVPLAPDKQIRCVYDDEGLITALGSTFEKLVAVTGQLHYRKGELWPFRIDVGSIRSQEPMTLGKFLENMRPISLPVGMDSVSAIRSLRDAE